MDCCRPLYYLLVAKRVGRFRPLSALVEEATIINASRLNKHHSPTAEPTLAFPKPFFSEPSLSGVSGRLQPCIHAGTVAAGDELSRLGPLSTPKCLQQHTSSLFSCDVVGGYEPLRGRATATVYASQRGSAPLETPPCGAHCVESAKSRSFSFKNNPPPCGCFPPVHNSNAALAPAPRAFVVGSDRRPPNCKQWVVARNSGHRNCLISCLLQAFPQSWACTHTVVHESEDHDRIQAK